MPVKPPLPDPQWGFGAPVGAIVEPPGGLRSGGWNPNDPHPAQFQNWLDNRYSLWVDWLRNSYPDAFQQSWSSSLGKGNATPPDGTTSMRVTWGVNAGRIWRVPISVPAGYTINAYGCTNTLIGIEDVTLRLERWSSSAGVVVESSVNFPAVPVGDPVDTVVTTVEDPVGLPYQVISPGGLVIAVFMNTSAGANAYLHDVYASIEPTS